MEEYIQALERFIPYAAIALGGCTWGMDKLARAELAFFQGDLEAAERLAIAARDLARERDQWETENRALFFLLRIAVSAGSWDTIRGIFEDLKSQLLYHRYINRYTYYDIVMGWFYIQTGQSELAASWLKDDFEESDLNSMVYGLETLVKAKYHFAERRYPATLAALESRDGKYDATAFVIGKVEIKALEAVCRYRLRDREGAFAILRSARKLSESNGLFMPFTELGKDMRSLADAALAETPPGDYREWLLKIRRNSAVYATKLFTLIRENQKSAAPLSPREMDVLQGLSQGLTRAEIAKSASLSPNTVKSVLKSVYNKLGAVNQADAVRIAAGMGILR
jgi:LuxR family maltose regulon positive regulatory protein